MWYFFKTSFCYKHRFDRDYFTSFRAFEFDVTQLVHYVTVSVKLRMSYPEIETLEKIKIKGQDFFFVCVTIVFFPRIRLLFK